MTKREKLEKVKDRPTYGGFGSHVAKDDHQLVTPGHQHGQKRMPNRDRGSAIHHKDEQSRASAPEN
jgi:hypothetical protein